MHDTEAPCLLQLGSRMQHMVSTASSVLFDPERSGGALQKQASVLNRALQLGQAKPLRELIHQLRYDMPSVDPQQKLSTSSPKLKFTLDIFTEVMWVQKPLVGICVYSSHFPWPRYGVGLQTMWTDPHKRPSRHHLLCAHNCDPRQATSAAILSQSRLLLLCSLCQLSDLCKPGQIWGCPTAAKHSMCST